MRRRWLTLLLPMVSLAAGCGYNTIQTYDEQANSAQGQIEVQLQRRADLVPSLVNTVKGLAAHETELFTNVANARAGLLGAIKSGDAAQMANANQALGGSLSRLIAVAEAYPAIKADQAFLRLQDELSGTENRISTARGDYNQAAQQYNTLIRRFPAAITAKVTGAKPRTYFTVTTPGARDAPTVDFSKPAPPAAGAGATKVP
ncbi:MAG: LemA family protein [Gemmatimonadaceae bacterium]